jgi:succinate dehydrogenase / fumarate reductase, iron-sulfur subunit
MTQASAGARTIKVFRFDPAQDGQGHYDSYSLEIPNENTTTILDVLLRLQREQDATLSFRYACRVNMCGSCGMVINGQEGLACKTNVSQIPPGQEITIRPLNHFPVIKDLVVDMAPFFQKYEESMPYFEPREELTEPAIIKPDTRERVDIGMATDCIACGCCVSSCTMCHYHEGYTGPAALNRAFTLLADVRDGLFDERLTRAMASCYNCRTEFNCTEVCPKNISGTRAIKYIQRLAVTRSPKAKTPVAAAKPVALPPADCMDRRSFLCRTGVALLGGGAALYMGGLLSAAAVAPALAKSGSLLVPLGQLSEIPVGEITTLMLRWEEKKGFYTQQRVMPVLVSRDNDQIVCFKASCTHLGCIVKWDKPSNGFKCACHGGTFDRQGKVLSGPPPRPLDRYNFKIDADHLLVEVG